MSDQNTDFELITRPDEVLRLAEELGKWPIVAVDTESNSLFAYREQVCLIQFSTPEQDYLLDPLALAEDDRPNANADLSALAPLFADPAIEKVFHAAEYDLLCLRRDFGFEFNNIFDTMVAARILGRAELGLSTLLEAVFGIHLDKRYQRADWGERPLSPSQLDYARMDTHHLIALRDSLEDELAGRGLGALAREDFHHSTLLKVVENGRGGSERPVDVWKVSGAYDLDPQQAAVLQELVIMRDEMARKLNRPLFKVIQDKTLIAVAMRQPTQRRHLAQIPGMTPRQIGRYGKALLDGVERGLAAPAIHPPRVQRPDDKYLARLDALRNWRKHLAQDLKITSDVILPRDLMLDLAAGAPKTMDELRQVMADFPWRLQYLGEEILKALTSPQRGYTSSVEALQESD